MPAREQPIPLLTAQDGGMALVFSGQGAIAAASAPAEVLLAGGFPSLHREDGPPLSPALLVNAHLGGLEQEALEALARAELARLASVRFPTREYAADTRVALLGRNPARLLEMRSSLEGLLEVRALLLGSHHPGLDTALELDIRPQGRGLVLEVLVPAPLNREACTLCRACVAACPEHCIAPGPVLDLAACTRCGLCAEACPASALDPHGVERLELACGTALCLDMAPPLDHPRVLAEDGDGLRRLLAGIHGVRVDQVLRVREGDCQHGGIEGAGCRLCLESCARQAIGVSGQVPEVDHLACVECGLCAGACPSGAMEFLRCTDQALDDFFRDIPLEPGTVVVLARARELGQLWWHGADRHCAGALFLEHPAPGALAAAHLLLLLARGAGRVLVCGPGPGTGLARDIVQALFGTAAVEDVEPGRLFERLDQALAARQEGPGGARRLPWQVDVRPGGGRRALLARLLAAMVERADAGDGERLLDAPGFARLDLDQDRCTHCLACLNQCRAGALEADAQGFRLLFIPALCLGCGLCAAACPEDALALVPGLALERDSFVQGELARAEPAVCPDCGKVFGVQKSLERVRALLAARGMGGPELDMLGCCDDCRVRRLFRAGEEG